MQIDCLIRSNKIVIFLNDPPEGPKQEKKSFQQKTQIKSQNKAKLNIVKLLEAYGITSRYITMIELRKLVNAKICETYIKSYYCNDCDIRYPLVFMHGIFFGSNDEIEFAHEEGFLYELFRDTGFYKLIDNMQPKPNFVENTQNEIKNVNQNLFESIDNMDESYLDCSNFEDTNYSFAIDKIVNLNTKSNDAKKVKSISNIETVTKTKLFRNISSESFNDFNSNSSSILSINKDSYCRHYVNNAADDSSENSTRKNYDVDLTNLIKENKKGIIKFDLNANNYASQSNNSMSRKVTPPGDVLATMNSWLKRTKEAINARNIQITKKNVDN